MSTIDTLPQTHMLALCCHSDEPLVDPRHFAFEIVPRLDIVNWDQRSRRAHPYELVSASSSLPAVRLPTAELHVARRQPLSGAESSLAFCAAFSGELVFSSPCSKGLCQRP